MIKLEIGNVFALPVNLSQGLSCDLFYSLLSGRGRFLHARLHIQNIFKNLQYYNKWKSCLMSILFNK